MGSDDTLFSIDNEGGGGMTRREIYQARGWDSKLVLPARGKVRRDHPETAQEAAQAIRPASGTQRGKVYQALKDSLGLTDEGIAAVTGLSPNSVRPRRVELVEQGLVVDSGITDRLASGRRAIVWRAV